MFDVIVIGAGPAGAAAAKALADSGYKVLIAERMKLPRYKSCSGVLIKKSMELVKQYFSQDIPQKVMCTPFDNHGMIFTDDKGREYAFKQDGINVWRSSFDNWLTENAVAAGAELRDGTAVTDCEQADGYVDIHLNSDEAYTEQARYVIDCEGVTSVVKRKLLGTSSPIVTTFQTFNIGKIDLDPHYFYAYLQPELSEYDAWFNVKDDMLVLGVAVKDTKKIPQYYSSFIKYMEEKHGLVTEKTVKQERWIMPHILPGCKIDHGVGRILFAGEAAGFLAPMGEGISAGMESGHSAASAVSAHPDDPAAVLEEYRQRTKSLKVYMERQWHFVASIADTFKDMRICRTMSVSIRH